ncbi:hypothetical protein AB0L57_20795 [Nocardia sp. NPDC052254]
MHPNNTAVLAKIDVGQRRFIVAAQSQQMPRRSRRELDHLVRQA